MSGSDILPDAEVERLLAEHDRLTAQIAPIEARIAEIDRAITASGEAKVRAIRDWDGELSSLDQLPGDGRNMELITKDENRRRIRGEEGGQP